MSLAIAIAGVLVHPGFIELMAKAAQGEHVEFAFIPVTAVKYTYTVIPALVMTWCLSYIERWVDRITPAVTKNFLKPMLIVLIAAPLAILLIGPLASGSAAPFPRWCIRSTAISAGCRWRSWAGCGRCW